MSIPVGARGEAVALTSVRLGHAAARFPAAAATTASVDSGSGIDAQGRAVAWLEARNSAGLDRVRWTMRGDRTLALDYAYRLDGTVQYHGITFDHPDTALQGNAVARGRAVSRVEESCN